VAVGASAVQRLATVFVAGFDFRVRFEQASHDVDVAVARGPVQRRSAVSVLGLNLDPILTNTSFTI
jgi:hypothetical protein